MTSAQQAADLVRAAGITAPLDFAVILGSGFGPLSEGLEDSIAFDYGDLPGFPLTSVPGHAGRLVIGRQDGCHIAYLQGRAHYYEEGRADAMAVPLETMNLLGATSILITCSAGSVKADLYPGSVAMITDHINLNGLNPLIGMKAAADKFVSLVDAYDKRLQRRLKRAATTAGIPLQEGVYMWFSGPSFETPAEIRMARTLGTDLVGMSLVPEVIIARLYGLRVLAITAVTNFGTGFSGGNPSHAETQKSALAGTLALRRLIRAYIRTKDEAWSGG